MRKWIAAAALALAAPVKAAPPVGAGDEQAIRALDAHWNQLIAARDADGVAALYASDGVFMPPNSPARQGAALRETWLGLLGAPGLQLVITPVQVEVAGSHDLAYDRGTYTLSAQSVAEQRGKYLVVWKKQAGQWKVVADVFNSDSPAR